MKNDILLMLAGVGSLVGLMLVVASNNWHLTAIVWNGVAVCLWFRELKWLL